MLSWTGRQVDDFVIDEPIGRGGMAVVYAAHQRSVARQVALKVIDLQPDGDGDFLKRFIREAEVIAMLEHIHILPVYGYGVREGEFAYFAMRLLRHGTLADALRNGALPLDDVVDLFTQIASGLDYMHSRGVIHRDLKPSNILLDETGNAYLSDFGLARSAQATINFSEEGVHVAGSPAYIAPELIEGEGADHLSDIYSLGVILYQMLCGRPPFEDDQGSVSALLYKHLREKPPPPRQFNPAIPPEVEAVVLRALSKNPHARYLSAAEMAYELRSAAQRSPAVVSRITPLFASDLIRRTVKSRRPLYIVLILCICAMIAVTAVVLVLRNRGSTLMNVEPEVYAGLADLTLSDAEIARARAQLGQGFIADFPCTLSDMYQTAMARELNELATKDGLTFQSYDSQDNPARQIRLIDQARSDGAKAFILCPLDKPLLDDSIQSLQQAHIPLVFPLAYDSSYGIKVVLDEKNVGQQQGRFAGQLLQANKGGTVVLLTMLGVLAGQERAQGMQAGLRETAPQAKVIGPLDGYTRAQAAESIRGLIASGTHFDGIIAVTDASALGAIDALKAANLTPPDVFVVSANNEQPISAYIHDGYYVRGAVSISHTENAQLAMIGIIKALAGSPVPEYLTLSSGELVTSPLL